MVSKRTCCNNCLRPASECYCHNLTTLQSEVNILILQHPSEINHPFNTARMTELSVASCSVVRGERFELGKGLLSEYKLDSYMPMLLYPGDGAQPVASFRKQYQQQKRAPLLIVPDGTWRKVRKILHCSPEIAALPKVDLGSLNSSLYAIRKSNQKNGVSTVEACYHLLSQWHQSTERFRPLLQPLLWVVERQQAYTEKA